MSIKDYIKLILGEKIMDYLRLRRYPYLPINAKRRETPVEPWAFIRVKNEIHTIQAALNSILPAIKKGIIGYNPSDDGTDLFIEQFCKENPGFIPFKYDYDIVPACDIRYKDIDKIPYEQRLDGYYNAVLSKIPMGEWFIKIDGDHIYDAEKLKQMFYLPKDDHEFFVMSRINLHIQNGRLFFIKNNPFYYGGDHWLIKKTPKLQFSMSVGTGATNFTGKRHFYAWEGLNLSHLKGYSTDLLNWHFPLIKKYRSTMPTDLLPFSQIHQYIDAKKNHIPQDMLNEQLILEKAKQFHLGR